MISGDVIIEDLKSLLEGNTDLQTALGTVAGTSKVMIRNMAPLLQQAPTILISDLTIEPDRLGQRARTYIVSIDLLIITQDLAGTERPDYERMYSILALVDDAIRGSVPTVPAPFKGETDTMTYARFDLVGTPAAVPQEGGYTAKQVTYRGMAQEK